MNETPQALAPDRWAMVPVPEPTPPLQQRAMLREAAASKVVPIVKTAGSPK
jgi:hypothetical protein